MKVVRVMCSASVSPHYILRALQSGVDGVFIGGCHLGDCHYLYGNYSTKKRTTFLKKLLDFSGVNGERLRVRWVSSAEGPEFVHEVKSFVEDLKKMGPSPLKEISKPVMNVEQAS